MSGSTPAVDSPSWRTKAWTIVVGGDAESTVLSVARALAETLDPNFAWLEIVDPRRQDPDPPIGDIPSERVFHRVLPAELRPHTPTSPRKLRSMVDPEDSPETLERLQRLLRLPEIVQRLAMQSGSVGPRRLLAIGRGERLVTFYPDGSRWIPEFLRTLESHGITLLVSYFGPARQDRLAFDIVLRTHGTGPSAFVSVEKGDPSSALATGARFPARSLGSFLPQGY